MNRTFPRRSSTSSGAGVVAFASAVIGALLRSRVPRIRRKDADGAKKFPVRGDLFLAKEEARALRAVFNRSNERVTGETTPRRDAESCGGIIDTDLEDLAGL